MQFKTVTTGTPNGSLGILVYTSYDEYQGQFVGDSPVGLGVYKVYLVSFDFTPNSIHHYRGEIRGEQYVGQGVYEFGSSQYFAGEWIDSHPYFGIRVPCDNPQFDFFCGGFGAVQLTKAGTAWRPHGKGIGINLLRNELVYGTFHEGIALKDVVTVPFRSDEPLLLPNTSKDQLQSLLAAGNSFAGSKPTSAEIAGKDKYASFAQLQESEMPDAYAIIYEDRNSSVAVMAPHGGGIEPGTLEIARAIAGKELSWYGFEGRLTSDNTRLHITSTNFDEPNALRIASSAQHVLSIHGDEADEAAVYIGGLDRELMDRIEKELEAGGFVVKNHPKLEKRGLAQKNICNRGATGKGVQLELPTGIRRTMYKELSREGAQTTTPEFDAFVAAVRRSLIK